MPSEQRSQNDDWIEYKKLVLNLLETYDKNHRELVAKVMAIEIALVTLKTEASTWGAVWGAAGGIVCSVIGALIVMQFKGN